MLSSARPGSRRTLQQSIAWSLTRAFDAPWGTWRCRLFASATKSEDDVLGIQLWCSSLSRCPARWPLALPCTLPGQLVEHVGGLVDPAALLAIVWAVDLAQGFPEAERAYVARWQARATAVRPRRCEVQIAARTNSARCSRYTVASRALRCHLACRSTSRADDHQQACPA